MITQTNRLIIRPFTEQDCDALYLMNSNPAMLKYIPTAAFTSREQAVELFHQVIQADYQQHGFGRWAVEHKADNKVIGFAGLNFCQNLMSSSSVIVISPSIGGLELVPRRRLLS